jgi:hypothetical protein
MEKKDGGPATQLSVRDYMASAALQGHMAIPDERTYSGRDDKAMSVEEWQLSILRIDAEFCYRMADAMIAARGAE